MLNRQGGLNGGFLQSCSETFEDSHQTESTQFQPQFDGSYKTVILLFSISQFCDISPDLKYDVDPDVHTLMCG